MTKILLLSVSAGAGHARAAEALRACAAMHPAGIEAVHLDVMDFVPASFRALYTDFYVKLVTHQPALWGYLYQKTDKASPRSLGERVRRAVERINCHALKAEIARQNADVIVCTHFLPAELLARERRRGQLDTPVWVQVTDFDLHRLWVVPGLQGYFAANGEVAARMIEQGLPAHAVHVSGIPVMPAFGDAWNRDACAAEFGLNPRLPTFVMMSGGAGLGGLEALASRVLAMPGEFQIVALAGRNEAMLASLRELARRHPGRLLPMGFTSHVERVMACADLVITKPGGLTTSECLAMRVPMIVTTPIPGQEERNADFLLEHGVALKAVDAAALEYRLRLLLDDPHRLAAMRERIAPLSRPHAARVVLDTVLASLQDARAEAAA